MAGLTRRCALSHGLPTLVPLPGIGETGAD
ncbi:hypothetical protein SAMN05216196_105170 [Lutimaribacter pacificus]|uniref:Uncharacterized protein n=1 Tax=Lutimaribacter pacificus TaxID=391948 RepID=A0A1H0J7Y4_9RHOB|nr:hypothetical protein SAMN05216196_105170 [Lutimaribacter pacificus]SHK13093.1 hypothetical protein SAMN05444142_103370 [Lutimaribacter pacificus]